MITPSYEYSNPDVLRAADAHRFVVHTIDPRHDNVEPLARDFQHIMLNSWISQLGESRADISLTVNPTDPELVENQAIKLRNITDTAKTPLYVHAYTVNGEQTSVAANIGVGKAVDAKHTIRRWLPPLADVGNIYVRPEMQGRGIGSAILRSLLDKFPTDLEVVVYDFAVNKRLLQTLGRLGFEMSDSSEEPYFGKLMEQVEMTGPKVGELIDQIEDKRPWLANRVQIT